MEFAIIPNPSTDAWAFSHVIHVPTSLSVVSTKEKTTKDEIVVEMKTNTKNEEAVLLKAVNGDKKGPNDQVTIVVDEQSQFTLNFYATIFVVTAFLKLPSNAFIL